MMLQIYLDFFYQQGQKFQEDLSPLTDEKAISLYFKEAGGQEYVQSRINLVQLLDQSSEDLKNKLFSLPIRVVKENLVLALSQFSIESLKEWCDDLLAYSQQQFEKKGRKILTPNIIKKIASKFLPQPKPTKSCLKLHEPVGEEDFQVLLKIKKYGFTTETLEDFKAKVLTQSNPAIPTLTEHLFPFLEDRGLDPLLILSQAERTKWLAEKLEEQAEIHQQQLTLQQEEHQKEINQLKQQLTLQKEENQHEINQLKQQLTLQKEEYQDEIAQLKQQNQQFLAQMEEFKQMFKASQAA